FQTSRDSFEWDNLVTELSVARFLRFQPRIHILPIELLDRKLSRGLAWLDCFACKNSVAWQHRLGALVIDTIEREAHAPIRFAIKAPCDGNYVIIRKGNGVLHKLLY